MTTHHAAMLNAYEHATGIAADLTMTPKWRRRKRARLDAELTRWCLLADATRSPDAEPLREILRRLGASS